MAEDNRGGLFVALYYRDPHAAMDFLEKAFGAKRERVAELPDGHVIYSELSFDEGAGPFRAAVFGVEKELPDHYGGLRSPLDLGGVSAVPVLVVADLEAHFARAKAAGAEIMSEPHDNDYSDSFGIVFENWREYTCRDIEGHLWCFATGVGSKVGWRLV